MLALLLAAFVLSAQDKPPEKCSLSGTVVSSVTGELLTKVVLTLEPVDRSSGTVAMTTSDSEGHFAMVALEPGRYRLTGKRNGYLDTAYGARRPGGAGTVLRLGAGQELAELKLKVLPFGVISGTVRDSDGEPLNGAHVTVARLTYEHGKPRVDGYDSTETDDLGQYRLRGLPPGKYYVGARTDEDRAAAASPVPTYYPGATDASLASPIEVATGGRVTGIDITIARVRTYVVRGRVLTAAGAGASGASISLRGQEQGWNIDPPTLTTTTRNADGDFELRGVQVGHCWLQAARGESQVGVTPLDVTGDMEGVTVAMGTAARVRGSMAMESGRGVKIASWQVLLTTDGRNGYFLVPEGDHAATQGNVLPGHYEIQMGSPPGTYVKSIRAGETDVLNDGLTIVPGANVHFEILLAADPGKVEGTVTDTKDQPAPGATVVMVPEPKLRTRSDLFSTATTDQYGHYEVTGVAPGAYKVFAWDDVEPGIWNDPEFLKEHEKRGAPVTVGPKGHEAVKVKL